MDIYRFKRYLHELLVPSETPIFKVLTYRFMIASNGAKPQYLVFENAYFSPNSSTCSVQSYSDEGQETIIDSTNISAILGKITSLQLISSVPLM